MRRRLASDRRGTTVTEFGLIAPVFFTMLFGAFDMGHTLYMNSTLEGAVQKTARDLTLESGGATTRQDELDAAVRERVRVLASDATVTITRRYFKDFTRAAQAVAEPYIETNDQPGCQGGEAYQDSNNNNVWDPDGGDSGQGGAKDNVVYTVDIAYPRLFPMAGLIGLSPTVEVKAVTVLANQPYGEQAQYAAPTQRNCT